MIFVVDVVKVYPVLTTPPTVPTLTYDSSGNPAKFTADDQTTKNPTELGVYPIIKGSGPVLKSGDQITVEYLGQIYPDGNVFNAWTGQPFPTPIGVGKVIKGWDEGLVGQRVGSRVALVIPPALAYGAKKQPGIPANSTLIFAIQIDSIN